jgi:hypothetical protein
MRTCGTGEGEPCGHRLQLSHFLFPTPEAGGKTRLGGEVRREEQLLSRAGMRTDRDGTDEDLSMGFFTCLSPGSGTTGVARYPRLGKFAYSSSS